MNTHGQATASANERSTKILAKSFYRDLRQNGYTHNQVVSMASELISLVTQDLRDGGRGKPEHPPSRA
jgi:hypothetical protein